MTKIIDISKYFDKPKKGPGRPFAKPSKYCMWIESYLEDHQEYLEYMVSDDRLVSSKYGKEMIARHMVCILLSLCEEDPSLVAEVVEKIDEELDALCRGEEDGE